MIGQLLSVIWSYVDIYTVGIPVAVWWLTQFLMWKGYLFSKGNKAYGIYGVPLIGSIIYLLFGKRKTFEVAEDYAKKYGPVIRYRMGSGSMTVVCGAKAVREGMLNDDLLGRQNERNSALDKEFKFDSVLNLENDLWKKHRRFSLITLRDLGFGKTPIMEERIQEEIRELKGLMEAKNGEPLDIHEYLLASTQNNMNTLVYGERLPLDSPKRKEISDVLNGLTEESRNMLYVAFVPKLIPLMYKLQIGVMKRMTDYMRRFRTLIKNEITSHRANLDRENPKDYMDHYLLEQEKDEDFTEDLVGGNSMVFFSAGSTTVQITVEYLLQLMAHYPEIQKKIQKEIDEITGRSREVTWADSPQMVYTMAVIAERHRHFPVTPTGVPRRALRDTKLCGFDIPALETVLFSIDSVHYDTDQFEDPYEFRPERFIDANGKLVNTEKVWAFSIGKRACPGETLAVMEVFLYFTMLLQNFTVVSDEAVKFNPLRGLIADTIKQKLRYIKRE